MSESRITQINGFHGEGGRGRVESEKSCLNCDSWDFGFTGLRAAVGAGKVNTELDSGASSQHYNFTERNCRTWLFQHRLI